MRRRPPLWGWCDFGVLSWNICGGLVRKLNDVDIGLQLKREHFIFLSETQTQREWQIRLRQQYAVYRKDRARGKAGGVAWLVHRDVDSYVTELYLDAKGFIVLQVDLLSRGGGLLFLIGVYFPPEGSASREARAERAYIIDNMPGILAELSMRGQVLLVGDTNARVGNNVDDELTDGDDFEEVDLVARPRACNADVVTNLNGEVLLSWARAGDLWLMNGRAVPNVHTFYSKLGMSNCDTWICSGSLLEACSMGRRFYQIMRGYG